jgi:acyl-CoA synthetase (AMP-forming)/AMP-acid ligase II
LLPWSEKRSRHLTGVITGGAEARLATSDQHRHEEELQRVDQREGDRAVARSGARTGKSRTAVTLDSASASNVRSIGCSHSWPSATSWSERPKAFVALRPEASTSGREIISFCRERLAHFKAPDAVEFGDLPKTATGKIQKYLLREREWRERGKRVN